MLTAKEKAINFVMATASAPTRFYFMWIAESKSQGHSNNELMKGQPSPTNKESE